jgi:hypothetical protein
MTMPRSPVTSVSSASLPPGVQAELFQFADERTRIIPPCPQCASAVRTIGSGSGPHYRSLTCLRGHFLRWLPKPRRGAIED